MQHDIDAVGLEVGPDAFEKIARLLAVEHFRRIAGPGLAALQLVVILALIGLASRYVTDLLEAEGYGVVGPHIDRMAQDRMQRLRHIEITHAATGDA